MSLEMKKQLLMELMDLMDDNMMSKFKKPGQDEGHEIEMSKMKVDSEELPADIEVKSEDDDQIDPEMLRQLMEMNESKDDKEGC